MDIIQVLEETKRRVLEDGLTTTYYIDFEGQRKRYCVVGHLLSICGLSESDLIALDCDSIIRVFNREKYINHDFLSTEDEVVLRVLKIIRDLGIEEHDLVKLQKENDSRIGIKDTIEHREAVAQVLDELIEKYKFKQHEEVFA